MKADGADPNTRDIYGQTIMHEIAREWHADCAKFFSEFSHDFSLQQLNNSSRGWWRYSSC